MADHATLSTTENYATLLANRISGRMDDISKQFDPAVTTATNIPVNTIRWVTASNKWEKWNGTAWNNLSANYAISISGNAATTTNGVVTTGSYANPSWITSLAASKLTSTVAVANGGTGAVDAAGARTNLGAAASGSNTDITSLDNLLIGRGGGSSNTNTRYGSESFTSNTSGTSNTAVGYRCLRANTTGFQNVAVGVQCLNNQTFGFDNTAVGYRASEGITTGYSNIAIGSESLLLNSTGVDNTSVGVRSLRLATGSNNTAVGSEALLVNSTGANNTAVGADSLRSNTTTSGITAVGCTSLFSNTTGIQNTAVGFESLYSNTTAANSTAVGYRALKTSTGSNNTAVGNSALLSTTTGSQNTAVGSGALQNHTAGNNNTAVGYNTLLQNSLGAVNNTAVGSFALVANTTGSNNTAVGLDTLSIATTGSENTATGSSALSSVTTQTNCSGLGFNAQVTGSNQVQLGNSATTTYVYGTVQNRSDLRDKADVRDIAIGLEFINALRPVDYKWDMREDYRVPAPEKPSVQSPAALNDNPTAEQKLDFEKQQQKYDKAISEYNTAVEKWRESNKFENIVKDGSKKRGRYHQGLIAQEVKSVIDKLGIDFGGYQDHKLSGGEDVLSIGYDELIAPLIKSVQELSLKNSMLLSRIEALEKSIQ